MICKVETYADMESGEEVTVLTEHQPNGAATLGPRKTFLGKTALVDNAGRQGPAIEFSIPGASSVEDAFRLFAGAKSAAVASVESEMRKRILMSASGVGVEKLRVLKGN